MNADAQPRPEEASWHHLLEDAKLRLDDNGSPVLQVRSGGDVIEVGITRETVLSSEAPLEIVQQILVARLREQLRGGRAVSYTHLDVYKRQPRSRSPHSCAKCADRRVAGGCRFPRRARSEMASASRERNAAHRRERQPPARFPLNLGRCRA